MIEDRWEENRDAVLNVDVRAPREFSHTCTEWEKEQFRIDWRVRNANNMKLMREGVVTPIYQK